MSEPRSIGGQFHIVDYYQYVYGLFRDDGVPIVRGRSFQPTMPRPRVWSRSSNEKFADTFWRTRPDRKRVKPCATIRPVVTVVGVAKDVKQGASLRKQYRALHVSEQVASPSGPGIAPLNHVVPRTTLTPAALAQTIERTVREQLDPSVPVVRLRDMETVLAESIQRPRFLAQLLGVFAGLALLLAAVGTYGVVSSIVAERRSEIAIRMALGANRSSVLAHVMSEGLVLTGVGVGVGLAGAFGLTRLVASLLFGVRPTDLPTVAGVAATMIIVAAAACVLPAWRASRLDPIEALRAE